MNVLFAATFKVLKPCKCVLSSIWPPELGSNTMKVFKNVNTVLTSNVIVNSISKLLHVFYFHCNY